MSLYTNLNKMATATLDPVSVPQSMLQVQQADTEGSRLSLNDYVINGVAGKGKFSEVFKATRGRNVCALKKFSKDCMETDGLRKRVEEEIKLLQSLDHPNIVKHSGMFRGAEGEMYIELEWADGGDLRQLLRRHKTNRAHFSESRIWNFFVQIVRGVHHMHERRVMHRDLKPANILVMRDLTIKVADLGLSKKMSEIAQEMHSRVGTPLYMAPEVLNSQGYSFSSDIWSMGCILYEMICLTSPFRSGSRDSDEDEDDIVRLVKRVTSAIYPEIPPNLPYKQVMRDLVHKMLIPTPTQRISCDELLETTEAQNKVNMSSLSPSNIGSKSISSVTVAHAASQMTSSLNSREPMHSSPPLSSPRTTFSEMTETDRITRGSLSNSASSDSSKFRPPALSIPGDGTVVGPGLLRASPNSARVLTNSSPETHRLRQRRFSAENKPSVESRSNTPPMPAQPPAQQPAKLATFTSNAWASRIGSVPQSPRLTRLVSSGTVISQPSSPNSAQPSQSNIRPLASPTSARLPRANTSSPYTPSRKHRRAASATASEIVSGGSGSDGGSSMLAYPLTAVHESPGSEVSSPATNLASDDDEKRSAIGGNARARAAFQRLSVATDKESLKTSAGGLISHAMDPKTAPVGVSGGGSHAEFRRFTRTAVPSGELYSPSMRGVPPRFPATPTSATATQTAFNTFALRASSSLYATPRAAVPATEKPNLMFPELIMPPSKINPFATQENPFSTAAATATGAAHTPRSARSDSTSNVGAMATIAEDNSPDTAGDEALVDAPVGSQFKFSLWSNAGSKKRPQALTSFAGQFGVIADSSIAANQLETPEVASQSGVTSGPSTAFLDKAESGGQEAEFPYLLGAVIGEGSFARVYRAVDPDSGMSVAVKQMHVGESDSEAASQMAKEISFLKTLSHPNLVKYIGVRRTGSQLSIILEFCTEGSLTSMLRMYKRFPDRLIRLYTKQMVDALIYLHELKIVHRDIKGGNVLVHGDGSRGIVKLSDFGCSKKLGTNKNLERSSKMKGTVLWMAPEAALQSPETGTPSDIWSLGATVIEMATGRPPWTEEGLVDEIPALIAIATTQKPPKFPEDHISAAGLDFLRVCMEVDARKRWTAKQLALHEFLVVEQTVQVSTAEVGRRPDIVGASYNALRAAVRGRDLLLEREQVIKLRMRKAIEDLMINICKMDASVNWRKLLTSDAEILMPMVAVQVTGLPCSFDDGTRVEPRIDGLNAFEERVRALSVASQNNSPDGVLKAPISYKFVVHDIKNTKELIQVESRTAMWKWEIRGALEKLPDRTRFASGSAMITFEPSGQLAKSIEFVWDATGFVDRLGIDSQSLASPQGENIITGTS